jgi:hypothetical protein
VVTSFEHIEDESDVRGEASGVDLDHTPVRD